MEVLRILNVNYHPATKWSNRQVNSRRTYTLMKRIRRFLKSVSGDDIVALLIDVLNKEEKEQLSLKYIDALKNLSNSVNNTSIVKQKKNIILYGLFDLLE